MGVGSSDGCDSGEGVTDQNTERKRASERLTCWRGRRRHSRGLWLGCLLFVCWWQWGGMEWAWQHHRTRGAVRGTGQDGKKASKGHALAGRGRPRDWSGRGKRPSMQARCTLAGEDVDETTLMFP